MLENAKAYLDCADGLRRGAAAMNKRRVDDFKAKKIDETEFDANARQEIELHQDISKIVRLGINEVVSATEGAQADLLIAIDMATAQIVRLDEIRKALDSFAALITLGAAIVAREPKGILSAFKNLKNIAGIGTTKQDGADEDVARTQTPRAARSAVASVKRAVRHRKKDT